MDERAKPLSDLLELNHHLVLNCVDDLPDAQARARVLPTLNSISFLLAHLIDVRHTLLGLLGGSAPNPVAAALDQATSIENTGPLPTLEELVGAWRSVHASLVARLSLVDTPGWDAESPPHHPGVPKTVLGAFAFLMQHESYHLGQIAMLRRAHGLPGMRYSRRAGTTP